jgi:formylglycine-generating enzyme required for sulfatase activity
VVGVSLDDARRFCAWLSKKEGRTYRLPTSAEWSAAVGPQKYPWGDSFPPPKGAGNYGGSESRHVPLGISVFTIPGYNDGYPRTSPVGSFAPNRSGLYDMGGNVAQWCDEEYKSSGILPLGFRSCGPQTPPAFRESSALADARPLAGALRRRKMEDEK